MHMMAASMPSTAQWKLVLWYMLSDRGRQVKPDCCMQWARPNLTLQADVRATAAKTEFHKLKILSTEAGGPDDQEGLVRFTITFKTIGQTTGGQRDSQQPMQTATELSSFKRRDGAWSYVDAVESDYTAHTY